MIEILIVLFVLSIIGGSCVLLGIMIATFPRTKSKNYLVTWRGGFSEMPESSEMHHWEGSKIFEAENSLDAVEMAKEYEGSAHYFILTDVKEITK